MTKIRTSVAVLGAGAILFLGYQAIGQSAKTHKPDPANATNETMAAYNTSKGVFEGVSLATGDAIAWMGAAAFIMVVLGFLYYAGTQGR